MDISNISPQIDRLDGELDKLEEVLQPLLGSVSEVASKLPLLDKAKLYVLVTYSIESMLFSSLRLNAVDAKEHPVFKELTRVRQYFDKIKNIENPPQKPQKPEQSLNKEAAIRFLRSDLADNKEVNTKLTEMIAKERAKAALKSAQKQQQPQKQQQGSQSSSSSKRKVDESTAPSEEADPDTDPEKARKKKKKERKEKKSNKTAK